MVKPGIPFSGPPTPALRRHVSPYGRKSRALWCRRRVAGPVVRPACHYPFLPLPQEVVALYLLSFFLFLLTFLSLVGHTHARPLTLAKGGLQPDGDTGSQLTGCKSICIPLTDICKRTLSCRSNSNGRIKITSNYQCAITSFQPLSDVLPSRIVPHLRTLP